MEQTVTPPPGFVLDSAEPSAPTPPPGFVLDKEPSKPKKAPEGTGLLKGTKEFGSGAVQSAADTLSAIGSAVRHPVETAQGLGSLGKALFTDPGGTLKEFAQSQAGEADKPLPYRAGYLTSNLAQLLVPGAAVKGLKAARAGRAAKALDEARQAAFYAAADKPVEAAAQASKYPIGVGTRFKPKLRAASESGAISPKLLLPLGGGAAGAAGGAALGNTEEERNILSALGGLTGATAGAVAMNPARALQLAKSARIESMLSGLAIPKNIATDLAAFPVSAIEGAGSAPLKELFRVPTNVRQFGQAWKSPTYRGLTQSRGPMGPVGRTIGAIDETTRNALQRAGVGTEQIDRLLFTKPRAPLFSNPTAQELGELVVPFQRVPMNVFEEGIASVGDFYKPGISGGRRALTAASVPGGAGIGAWVASGETPQERVRRGVLASVLLSSFGPRALLGTTVAAGMGANRAIMGSLTPIPEFALQPKGLLGFPPSFVHLMQRLSGDK